MRPAAGRPTLEDADLIKPALLIAALLALPTAGQAKDKLPYGASIGTTFSFNHANFESLGAEDAGWVVGTLNASMFYITPVKGLIAFGGMNIQRPLRETFDRAFVGGGVPVQPYTTQLSDVSLGASYNLGKTGPVVHVVSGGVVVPTSNTSRATGLITRFSPSYTAQFILPAQVAISTSVGGSVNALEDPTIQLDCGRFANLCRVRGGAGALAAPNQRASIDASIGVNWQTPLPGFGLNVGYFWTNGMSAVEFADDEFTSPYAQTGAQVGTGLHGSSFRVTIAPALIGIAAPPPGVPLAALQGSREPSIIDAFVFSFGMSTFGSVYTNDNKSVRNPFFDTESGTHNRTNYFFRVTARL